MNCETVIIYEPTDATKNLSTSALPEEMAPLSAPLSMTDDTMSLDLANVTAELKRLEPL
jgi:hypothetical protein